MACPMPHRTPRNQQNPPASRTAASRTPTDSPPNPPIGFNALSIIASTIDEYRQVKLQPQCLREKPKTKLITAIVFTASLFYQLLGRQNIGNPRHVDCKAANKKTSPTKCKWKLSRELTRKGRKRCKWQVSDLISCLATLKVVLILPGVINQEIWRAKDLKKLLSKGNNGKKFSQ